MSWRSKAFGWSRGWFAERQLILRQGDGVKALRLTTRTQLTALALVAVAGAWTLTATAAYLTGAPAGEERLPPLLLEAAAEPEALPMAPILAAPAPVLTSIEPTLVVHDDADAQRAAALAEAAAAAESRAAVLEHALHQTRQQLDEVETARRTAIEARDGLALRLKDSEARVKDSEARVKDSEARARAGANQQTQQDESLRRLAEETRRSLGEVERILNATGIDAARRARLGRDGSPSKDARPGKDKLGAKETDNGTAEGGPFIAWSRHRQTGPATPHLAAMGSDLARLAALTDLLRAVPLAAPLGEYTVTSRFGHRVDPFNGQEAMHEGVDLLAPRDTPVLATAPGTVVFAGSHGSYGLMVEIDHGHDLHTRYAHLDRVSVTRGAKVTLHQKIGLLGSTGRSSGPHVHYEVLVDGQPHDPLNFLKAAYHVRKSQ